MENLQHFKTKLNEEKEELKTAEFVEDEGISKEEKKEMEKAAEENKKICDYDKKVKEEQEEREF